MGTRPSSNGRQGLVRTLNLLMTLLRAFDRMSMKYCQTSVVRPPPPPPNPWNCSTCTGGDSGILGCCRYLSVYLHCISPPSKNTPCTIHNAPLEHRNSHIHPLFLSLYVSIVHKLISWRSSHDFVVRDSKGALRQNGMVIPSEERMERAYA